MGQTNSQPSSAGVLNVEARSDGEYEYYSEPFTHVDRPKLKPGSMIGTNYQCMLIGSYGDKYSDGIKDTVVPKKTDKPGGKFLSGVSVDLELVQDMIRNDPRKQLVYVLSDVPGAQQSVTHYLAKVEKFLKECTSGALIWYTGHGERMKGNWCFKDGVITFDQIFHLYEQHFRGRILTLVCDCCYAGQWVKCFLEKLDSLGIGACGHKTKEAGYLMKVFASCQPNETAYDTYYTKNSVRVDPTCSLMTFSNKPLQVNAALSSQTPHGIDNTTIRCFREPGEPCGFDQIPDRAKWYWKDYSDVDRRARLHKRLFRIWDRKEGKPYWRFVLMYNDKFEDYCTRYQNSGIRHSDINIDNYGYTVFCGYGETAPDDVARLFCHYGPSAVKLPVTKPLFNAVHM